MLELLDVPILDVLRQKMQRETEVKFRKWKQLSFVDQETIRRT